jgi:hypothetical protein
MRMNIRASSSSRTSAGSREAGALDPKGIRAVMLLPNRCINVDGDVDIIEEFGLSIIDYDRPVTVFT